jgi:large subunit ribosomal protein L9
VASKLVSTTITIKVKAGAEGRLFGSVTAADVAAAIHDQANIDLDRRKLTVDHIKTTGTYQVSAKLHHDVEFPITLEVVGK